MVPPHPLSPSPLSIPGSRTDIPHPSTHCPTPFAGHTPQTPTLHEHYGQQPSAPQVVRVGDYLLDGDDLADQGANDGSIIIGECLRTDSPCRLWVKVNKSSIKRHAQKWHRVARGGDTSKAPCTWAGCNTALQKSAVPRHTLCQHFGEIFECNGCSKRFTRLYSWKSHAVECQLGGYGYKALHSPSIRVIDVKDVSLRQGVQ
ncbi:hypothetical protein DFH29DRAFT_171428 [Suillus ampliporus]|nr:hypothetical protein DFH29DRAFT_171428 [Suillus ampliporus]